MTPNIIIENSSMILRASRPGRLTENSVTLSCLFLFLPIGLREYLIVGCNVEVIGSLDSFKSTTQPIRTLPKSMSLRIVHK